MMLMKTNYFTSGPERTRTAYLLIAKKSVELFFSKYLLFKGYNCDLVTQTHIVARTYFYPEKSVK